MLPSNRLRILSMVILMASPLVYGADSLSYSGRLVNANGSPVTGPVQLVFNLTYTDAPTVPVCTKTISAVPLTSGVFHVKLDFAPSECGSKILSQVLQDAPTNETIAVQVTDQTNSKSYPAQAIHSVPSSIMASVLADLGATAGQVLRWDGLKWAPHTIVAGGTGNGTLVDLQGGTGITVGAVDSDTWSVAISNSGVDTAQINDSAITNAKISSSAGIARSKLASGTANHVVLNDGSGVLSSAATLPLAQGGTASATASGARTNLGLTAVATSSFGYGAGNTMPGDAVPTCAPGELLTFQAGPTFFQCVVDSSTDTSKLPLVGGTMSGAIAMGSSKITGLGTPTASADATTKAYVDTAVAAATDASKLPLVGGTMTGVLNMGTSKITNLAAPTVATDAASKAYVDALSYWTLASGEIYYGGNVGIGNTNPASILDIASTTSGLLIPRMSTVQRDAITPIPTGSQIYNTSTDQLNFYNGTSWQALGVAGAGISSLTAGTGLSGGTITTSGTIAIAAGGVNTTQLADGSVTDVKVAAGAAIARSKLAAGTANQVIVNNGSGVLSSVAALPITQGGTGAATIGDARTALGLGTAAVANIGQLAGNVMSANAVPNCTSSEKLSMSSSSPYTWSCVADLDTAPDTTKLPLAGGTMSGPIAMGSNKITGVGTPTIATDAATKSYVDSMAAGASQWVTSSPNISFSGGRVGIGTTTPGAALEIAAAASDTSGNGALILTSTTAMQRQYALRMSNDPVADFVLDRKYGSVWYEALRVQRSNGFFGIGTSSPGSTLDVSGEAHFLNNYNGSYPTYPYSSGTVIGWNGGFTSPQGETDFINFPGSSSGGFNFVLANASGSVTSTPLVIRSSGNVGIGTTNPGYPLQLSAATGNLAAFRSTGANNAAVIIDNAAGGNQSSVVFANAATNKWQLGKHGDNSFFLYDYANARDVFKVDSSSNVLLAPSAGNVGIGTITPGSKLDVIGNANVVLAVTNNAPSLSNTGAGQAGTISIVGGDMFNANNRLRVFSAYDRAFIDYRTESGGNGSWILGKQFSSVADTLTVHGNGGVGIYRSAPAYALDVNGIVNASGFKINGTDISSGTVSSVIAGTGLSGGTITTTGTIALATSGVATANIAAGAVTYAKMTIANDEIPVAKITNLTTLLSGKEPSITAGTTAQYYRGDKTFQTLNTTAVPEGTNYYFTDARARATVLAGYGVGTAIPLNATDTFMQAFGKLEAQITATQTSLNSNGNWAKNSSVVYYNGGNVGIGTAAPSTKFEVSNGGADTIQVSPGFSAGVNYLKSYNVSGASYTDTILDSKRMRIYASGAENARFETNGGLAIGSAYAGVASPPTNGMIVSGNVGIGTASPAAVLHIKGDAAAYDPTFGRFIKLEPTTLPVQYLSTDYGLLGSGYNSSLGFKVDGNELMRIIPNGNVGIGTTAPGYKLDVVGLSNMTGQLRVAGGSGLSTESAAIRVQDRAIFGYDGVRAAVTISDGSTGKPIVFDSNGAERLRVDTTGKVGIGTSAPTATLDVNGVIKAGPVTADDGDLFIDFGVSNIRSTTQNCGAFRLDNLKDGATYSLVVKGAGGTLCSFIGWSAVGTGTSLTMHLPPDHGATTASKHTVYSFFVAGTDVYMSWTKGL